MTDRGILFELVDRMGAEVVWLSLSRGGWKCIVTGVELPPHTGTGSTPLRALAEVLVFAARIRWRR